MAESFKSLGLPLHLVKEHDVTRQPCGDYRYLNLLTSYFLNTRLLIMIPKGGDSILPQENYELPDEG